MAAVKENHLPQWPAPSTRRAIRLLRRLLRLMQWTVNLLVLATALMVLTPAGDWLGKSLLRVDPLTKSDYIVVLGGDSERTVEAAQLYRQGWADKVIISAKPNGARRLARTAGAYGAAAEDIILDDKPAITADHPGTIAALAGIDRENTRLIIVTSCSHTARARACFIADGYRNVCMRPPAWQLTAELTLPERTCLGRLKRLPMHVYEVLALGYYKLRGWI